MQAELRGKLSLESNQSIERMEDILTDYVFGVLRFVDRSIGLGSILAAAFPGFATTTRDLEEARFEFWPILPDGTEPDVLLVVGNQPVVVEAQLRSGFGIGETASQAQLVREMTAGCEWAAQRRLRPVLVLAVTDDLTEPMELEEARTAIGIPAQEDSFQWISWQRLARILEARLADFHLREQALVLELFELLEKRGVRYMFQGFQPEDYWIVSAAQRIASQRVFPTIATFSKELLARLADEGIVRATPESRLFTKRSESLNKPSQWGVSFLFLPLKGKTWPEVADYNTRHLYVQFLLNQPALAVGYRFRIPTTQVPAIKANLSGWVGALKKFSDDHRILVLKYPEFHEPVDQIRPSLVDETGCKLP